MPSSRVLVVQDQFAVRGGAERLVLDLATGLHADLLYGYRTAESSDPWEFPEGSRDLAFHVDRWPRGFRTLGLSLAFIRERKTAARYDTRIYSGIVAPFAASPRSAPGHNIYYCHTPPRFLFDQKAFYRQSSDALRRIGLALTGSAFERAYRAAVARMHVVVANSQNVRRRIKDYLGLESVVVYPPVDTAGFVWGEPQGYYLSTGRLAPLKRIDRIIDAFRRIPDKRLIVTSGGEDEAALRARAANAPNISFTGWTSEAELRSLVSGAIATIYVPVDEDFGISPVESLAAGKPVIGVAEGGLLETLVNGETGLLLPSDFSIDQLIAVIEDLTEARADQMRRSCEQGAERFTRARFLDGMRTIIASHARAAPDQN